MMWSQLGRCRGSESGLQGGRKKGVGGEEGRGEEGRVRKGRGKHQQHKAIRVSLS